MTGTGDGVGAVTVEMTLSQDRIAFPRLKRTERRCAAIYHLAVPVACSALGGHQIIDAVKIIYMWTLTPDRLFLRAASFVDQMCIRDRILFLRGNTLLVSMYVT